MSSNSEARKRAEAVDPVATLMQLHGDRSIRDYNRDESKDRPGEQAFTVWFKEYRRTITSVPWGTD